jgi:hypothetical protein
MKNPSTEWVPNNLNYFGYSSHERDEKRPNGVLSEEGRLLHSCLFIIDRIKRDLSLLSIGFNFVDELMSSFGSVGQNVNVPSIYMLIMMGFGRQMAVGVRRFHVNLCGQN